MLKKITIVFVLIFFFTSFLEAQQSQFVLKNSSKINQRYIKTIFVLLKKQFSNKNFVKKKYQLVLYANSLNGFSNIFLNIKQDGKVFFRSSAELVVPDDVNDIFDLFKCQVAEVLKKEKFLKSDIFDFDVTNGVSSLNIFLSWQTNQPNLKNLKKKFYIYRSFLPDGPFEQIAISDGTRSIDWKTEPGIRYWYKVRIKKDKCFAPFSEIVSGYRKIKPESGLVLKKILKEKILKKPKIYDKKIIDRDEKFLKITKPFLFNSIKLRLVHWGAAPYIKKGKIILYDNFTDFVIDYDKHTVYFKKGNKFIVKFFSHKLFALYTILSKYGLVGDEIFNRILRNAVVFALPKGSEEYLDENGVMRVVNYYEAVGVTSEYYKNYKNWASNTMLFVSNMGKIQDMIKQIRKEKGQ